MGGRDVGHGCQDEDADIVPQYLWEIIACVKQHWRYYFFLQG